MYLSPASALYNINDIQAIIAAPRKALLLASIYHTNTDPLVTKIRLRASFGV